MKTPLLLTIFFAGIGQPFAADIQPASEAAVAEACKVPLSAVTRTIKYPDEDPKLKERMVWIATYTFSKPVEFGIMIACLHHKQLKPESFAFIASRPELEYQRLELQDGSIIHHNLGDRGDQGTFYSTALVTPTGPHDYTLVISRNPGVNDDDLPVDIGKAGIQLIQKLTKQE